MTCKEAILSIEHKWLLDDGFINKDEIQSAKFAIRAIETMAEAINENKGMIVARLAILSIDIKQLEETCPSSDMLVIFKERHSRLKKALDIAEGVKNGDY